jgi:hypothetical protein
VVAGYPALVLPAGYPRAGSAVTDKSKRIRKMITEHPEMTDEQIARKIGMPNMYGRERVRRERYIMDRQKAGNYPPRILGDFDEKS